MPSAPRALVLALLLAFAAFRSAAAEPPRIVASIAPLHGLAAMVAEGVTTPVLLVPGNASPHSYSLRPSEARALDEADLVIWLGPQLETFLAGPLDSLAGEAQRLTIAALPDLVRLLARRGGVWGEHGHDVHDHDQDGQDAHDHDDAAALDPHLWLDPRNAMDVLDAIAATLVEIDPGNADTYRENARQARARIAALDSALAAKLAPLAGRPFVVFHDAYQYLEARYGLAALGAVTVSPDIRPGARRLGALRDEIADRGAGCIFTEPQFPPRVIELIADGTGVAIGVLDPLGADIPNGPDHYPALMERIAAAAAACLRAG